MSLSTSSNFAKPDDAFRAIGDAFGTVKDTVAGATGKVGDATDAARRSAGIANENPLGLAYVTLLGRRGGSALAAAAVNALMGAAR